MTKTTYGLVTIGNALVDVLSHTSEHYLSEQYKSHGMEKGSMNLVNAERAMELYNAMEGRTEMSGGSAGNTMACFASFGGKGAYIGKVGNDKLGETFRSDMQAMGATHTTKAAMESGTHTGRCMILITDDGQRTMNTFLGAAVELGPNDIDEEIIRNSAVTYLEGYLFDPPLAMEAFYKAAKIAHEAGRKVSLTLSDSFCVARHREAFKELVEGHVDILFANEHEIQSLYEVNSFEEVIPFLNCEISAITRSEKGSVIVRNGEITEISAAPVAKVVDTTGAGDAYAAGFLFGYTQGLDMEMCGTLGSVAAAEVISHVGPRPLVKLADLIKKKAA